MKILAVDQARKGAWAIFDYETKELLKYYEFDFDSKHYSFEEAVMLIEEMIQDVIIDEDITAVFIEDIQLMANTQSFKKLAQLQGVLINLFVKNNYLYDIIPPTKWQNYCKARGRKSKEIKSNIKELEKAGKKETKILSIQFAKDKFCIDTNNDNLADACCIGFYVVNNIEIRTEGDS